MISDKLFKRHVLEQFTTPSTDSAQFLAYIILSQKYPNLTYWSIDGYSCDALADYSIGVVWNRYDIIDWTTKEIIHTTQKQFWECTTQEIINTWFKINGETAKTKLDWLHSLKYPLH